MVVLGVSWSVPREVVRVPGEAMEVSWRPLGSLLEFLRVLGRLRGGFQGLIRRSWKALAALLEASWTSFGPV